jgi:DNA-binding NarL/FixJ family response regulator
MSTQDGIRLLFIDGHEDDRQYFASRLRVCSPEYRIEETGSGASGLALYQSRPFDCVVLELVLPDMSGFEVLLRLVPRPKDPGVAVVVLTKLYWPGFHSLSLSNGAQECLTKSRVSGDDLDKAIWRAIAAVPAVKARSSGAL